MASYWLELLVVLFKHQMFFLLLLLLRMSDAIFLK